MTPCRTLLAFDFGSRKIGVAVGQEITHSARPLTILKTRRNKPDWEGITRLIETWRPDALVVGVPLNMDGTEQDMTHAAKRFANQLQGRYHLPVFHADERLTTKAAEQMAGDTRVHVDALAAQLILETFFSEHPPNATES